MNTISSTSTNNGPSLLQEYKRKLDELLTNFNGDISERIYSKELIHLVRDVHKSFHLVPCPMSEKELRRIGIDRGTMTAPRPVEYKTRTNSKIYGVPHTGSSYGQSANGKFKEKTYHRTAKKLRRCRNPWKPVIFSSQLPSCAINDKTEKVTREIRGILNKITPSSYEELSLEIVEKQIWNDTDTLPSVVDVLFSKAIEDQMYIKIFAELCLDLFTAEELDVFDQCRFLKALARRCQIGLNSIVTNYDKEFLELEYKIEHEYQMSKKKRMEEDLEEMKAVKRRRSNGILRLIAHLCRVPVFHFQTIQNCFCRLIKKSKDSETDFVIMVEFATFFLSVVGPHAAESDDCEDQLSIINPYVSYLLKQKPLLPNRIKFLIMNLNDLRAKEWKKKVKKSELVEEKFEMNSKFEEEDDNKENEQPDELVYQESKGLEEKFLEEVHVF